MWRDAAFLFLWSLLVMSVRHDNVWSVSANDDVGTDDDTELMPSAANPPPLDGMPPLYPQGPEDGEMTGGDVPPPGGGLNDDRETTVETHTAGVNSTPNGDNATSATSGGNLLEVQDKGGDKSGSSSPSHMYAWSLSLVVLIYHRAQHLL